MTYAEIYLRTDLSLRELAERLGPMLGLQFEQTLGDEFVAFRGEERRIALIHNRIGPDPNRYNVELSISGNADRSRRRCAREYFEALQQLGGPLALFDNASPWKRFEPAAA